MSYRHFAVVLVGLVFASAAAAQDILDTAQGKSIKGRVETESAQGVKITAAKEMIPAEDIADVTYEVTPLEIRLNAYRPAVEADHKALKAAKGPTRKGLIETALKKYQETLVGLTAGQTNAQRNIEFRIAYLRALLAEDDPQDTQARNLAIAKLKEFKNKYASGWQIGRALNTLAELQVEAKDYAEAEETYRALAESKVAEALKEHAALLAASVPARAGNFAAAEKNLSALIASLPKGSPQARRAQIALGEAMVVGQKFDPAKAILQQVINEAKEPELKAAAYNALGICLYTDNKYQDARWNFLWVDVMFDQDKAEHAKALYYLWKIAEHLNESRRARESLDLLLNDRQLAGTEYQRKAQSESSKRQ
jgi:hypothetical protein